MDLPEANQKKANSKKKFIVKKSLNKKLPDFFFHILRTNPWNEFNCLRIFKNLQSNSKVISYVPNNNFSYTQLTLAFVPQITFTMVQTLFSISFFFFFFWYLSRAVFCLFFFSFSERFWYLSRASFWSFSLCLW